MKEILKFNIPEDRALMNLKSVSLAHLNEEDAQFGHKLLASFLPEML